jgi:hypothetical protein
MLYADDDDGVHAGREITIETEMNIIGKEQPVRKNIDAELHPGDI